MNTNDNRLKAHKLIDHIFQDLLPAHGMAQRPEQIQLSHRMLDAMQDGRIALCDAGTGIGKTYAYLAAATAASAFPTGQIARPIIISTSSIALQNAVLTEYLPLLSCVLMADGILTKPLKAVIRKGKSHYVCDERLDRRLRQVYPAKKNPEALTALQTLRETLDMDRVSHLSGYDRERVCVPQVCDCKQRDCRYQRFLKTCDRGQFLFQICNHNLLVADAIHRSEGKRPIFPEHSMESVSPSPFDYRNNCLLYLPQIPPRQRVEDTDVYFNELTAELVGLIKAATGHALVLFTSYAAMSAVKERLWEESLPFPLLTLGRNAPHIIEQFRHTSGAVLLATGAAWEGFDFPGDCVSLLIIPRLPFAYPDARKERELEKYSSLHAFIREVAVPEMQIKLRQGFGRAIRTESDTCVIAILDERACRGRRYAQAVSEALPEMRRTGSLREVTRFLREKKPESYFEVEK